MRSNKDELQFFTDDDRYMRHYRPIPSIDDEGNVYFAEDLNENADELNCQLEADDSLITRYYPEGTEEYDIFNER